MWIAFDLVTRLVIGGSLLIAGATKLASTVAWRQLWLAAYRLLPRVLVRPVARALPTIEVGVGASVAAGLLGRASAIAGASLLLALAAAVAIALARDLEVSCHCLTMVGEVISWRGVGRNVGLVAAASLVAWHGGADLLGATRLGWPVQAGAVAAGAVAVHASVLTIRGTRRRRALALIARHALVPAGQRG
jgi:hypothetical protein